MSDYLKPAAMLTAITSTIGGGLGFAVAGPAGVVPGMKIGGAVAIQAAVVNKAEQGVDAAGRKIEEVADKIGGVVEKVGNVAERALVDIADKWSKLMLVGYAVQIAQSGTATNLAMYQEYCPTIWDNINCVPLFLTTITLTSCTAVIGVCFAAKIYSLLQEKK